jgi:hypothetical protein
MTLAYDLYRSIKIGNANLIQGEQKLILSALERSEKFILPQCPIEGRPSTKLSLDAEEVWLFDYEDYQKVNIKLPYPIITVEYHSIIKGDSNTSSAKHLLKDVPINTVILAIERESDIFLKSFGSVRKGIWAQYPYSALLKRNNLGDKDKHCYTINSDIQFGLLEAKYGPKLPKREKELDDVVSDLDMDLKAIMSICAPRKGQKIDYPYSKSKSQRSAMSKLKKMFVHRQLFFSPIIENERKTIITSTHASPAMHKRRGHFRQLKSGKIVWVKNTIVGKPEDGVITKDYVVVEPAI